MSFTVTASARLHFGFLDLRREVGGMTRPRFGSIGMALASPVLTVEVSDGKPGFQVQGEGGSKIAQLVRMICEHQATEPEGMWTVSSLIPAHQGLGSGTQMVLATGRALAKLQGFSISNADLAAITHRGRRSGIGIGSFETGGFLVDGGKLDHKPPAIVTRLPMPESWRVLLIRREDVAGLHGGRERVAFDELPTFSSRCTKFMHQILEQEILPALSAAEFAGFAAGLTRFQDTTGDYFSAIQKNRYADRYVTLILEYLRGKGITGIGQSSWGPTGFVFAPDQERADSLVNLIQAEFPEICSEAAEIKLQITRANNQGAGLA